MAVAPRLSVIFIFQLSSSEEKIDIYLLQLLQLWGCQLCVRTIIWSELHFTGDESSGPAALGLQQPSDGRRGTGTGLRSGSSNIPTWRKYERLEQPAQSQPPAYLLSYGRTVSRAQPALYIMMGQQPWCVQDIIVRDLAIYCTDRLLHVTLMRLSKDLRYNNQSSSIKFPSIFTEKLTYYVNQRLLPAPCLCEWNYHLNLQQ